MGRGLRRSKKEREKGRRRNEMKGGGKKEWGREGREEG